MYTYMQQFFQFVGDKKNTIWMTISLNTLNRIRIWFVVAGGGYCSYYNLQCIRLDRESKNVKKISFKHTKEI